MDVPASFSSEGYALLRAAFSPGEVASLLSRVRGLAEDSGGERGLHEHGWMRELATCGVCARIVASILGSEAVAVRVLYFDKQPGRNWKVPYHQDVTIAVRERHELAGYGPWSTKAGVVHVQPPTSVLENMASLRIHLDDCGLNNGPLRVIPSTHMQGKISTCDSGPNEVVCAADAGDVLVMRPLVVHASSPAREPSHRRVIHIEYAKCRLPEPVEWFLGWPLKSAQPSTNQAPEPVGDLRHGQ